METKVKIKKMYATLDLHDKLSLLEELSEIIESECHVSSLTKPDIFQNTDETAEEPDTDNSSNPTKCIECNSEDIIGWGHYMSLKRYKCKSCNRTFTEDTLTVSHGIHKISKFVDYGKTMFNGQYHSLSYMSKKFDINIKTAFDWRHKYLASISSESEEIKYNGNVEMDDIWIRFNEKGRKGKTNSRKRSGGKPGDNDEQVKILFSVERKGDANFAVVRSGRLCKDDIKRAVSKDCFGKEAILISDKHPSIKAFAKEADIEHKTFKAGKHAKDKTIHVQTVNNMASRFKTVINNNMGGVATKYLQNYANWFAVEERYKNVIEKIAGITERYMSNCKAWDYFSNIENIYKRFLEKYSNLNYEHPVKKTGKPVIGILLGYKSYFCNKNRSILNILSTNIIVP